MKRKSYEQNSQGNAKFNLCKEMVHKSTTGNQNTQMHWGFQGFIIILYESDILHKVKKMIGSL